MEDIGTKYLTAIEAAERLRVSRNVIYQALRTGRIRAIKIGGWRIPEGALSELEIQDTSTAFNTRKGHRPTITKIRR